jgi:DNA replication protein DnaC
VIEISGVMVPDDFNTAYVAARGSGRKAFIAMVSANPNACHNCGGARSIFLSILEDGPYHYPPPKVPITWHEDAWWKRKLVGYACPVCNAESAAERIYMLWQGCGLEEFERETWRLDFFEGLAGKEKGLETARETLASTPAPQGWAVYHGGYGVGKTGLLKSMTAAFVRAGVAAHYCRAGDILSQLRASYGDDTGENEAQAIRRYAGYRFLAIDEIDRVSGTAWALERMFSLFDDRYRRRGEAATAMATNTAPGNFGAEWGYFESRARDGVRVEVAGRDMRG